MCSAQYAPHFLQTPQHLVRCRHDLFWYSTDTTQISLFPTAEMSGSSLPVSQHSEKCDTWRHCDRDAVFSRRINFTILIADETAKVAATAKPQAKESLTRPTQSRPVPSRPWPREERRREKMGMSAPIPHAIRAGRIGGQTGGCVS